MFPIPSGNLIPAGKVRCSNRLK
uniref:Uncharacterized protein n=1 Tax=Arundo donax TaxID=35708 RepID=A0A0A9BS07_ARUDO